MKEIIMFFLRLVWAVPLMVMMMLVCLLCCLYCGLGWVFTGEANFTQKWPSWQ